MLVILVHVNHCPFVLFVVPLQDSTDITTLALFLDISIYFTC